MDQTKPDLGHKGINRVISKGLEFQIEKVYLLKNIPSGFVYAKAARDHAEQDTALRGCSLCLTMFCIGRKRHAEQLRRQIIARQDQFAQETVQPGKPLRVDMQLLKYGAGRTSRMEAAKDPAGKDIVRRLIH